MQTENKIIDDIAKLASGAAGALHGMREEIEAAVRARVDRVASELDLVSREEFEVVRAMAETAREENEALKVQIAALEKLVATTIPSGKKGKKKG